MYQCADGAYYLRHKITTPATSSGLAVSGFCDFIGILMKLDGTNAVTLNIYDSTSASGKRLVPTDLVIPTNSTTRIFLLAHGAISCTNGIYVEVTCAGSVSYQILYNTVS